MKSKLTLLLITFMMFGQFKSIYSQTSPSLHKALKKEFSDKSMTDGRWVYYPEKANIEKIEKPSVNAALPDYVIYSLNLKNYLGYHVNEATCVVLFDSLKKDLIFVQPIWYGGISEQLIQPFLKKPFENKEKLMSFLGELNTILEIGSGYTFVNTGSSDSLITYDLVYEEGDSYTTGNDGIQSTVNYTEDGIWRTIEISIKNLEIVKYVSINPRLKDDVENKRAYKQVID